MIPRGGYHAAENMLKIAVFDIKSHAEQLEDVLVNILFDRCEFGFEPYTNKADALAIEFDENFDFDIVFTEIDEDSFPGLEIAKRIRESGNIKSEIVFMSSDEGFALYGYKLRVFDYLIKPIPVKLLSDTLSRFFCYYDTDLDDCFSFKSSGSPQKIKCEDIYYFMSNNRKCVIVNKREDCEFYAKLDEVEPTLDAGRFIRIHQSYIVNMKYIKSLTKEGISLVNGLYLPISQRRYAYVKSKFMEYLEIEE